MKDKNQKFTLDGYIQMAHDNDNRVAEDVTDLCERIRFTPQKIVHVGASTEGELEYSEFIKAGAKAFLFEPHPEFYKTLVKNHGDNPNISIFNIGIYNRVGKFKFLEKWASSCLELVHQATLFEKENGSFYANCALFSGFDDGDIDLLILDTNGAEWFVIEKLISRPVIIAVETHYIFSKYKNPFLKNILKWMDENDYMILAQNESDTVFIQGKKK